MRIWILAIALLICFSCKDGAIPTYRISTEKLINFESKTPCFFRFNDSGKTIETQCTAKYRGGFSSGFQKKSYRIELTDKLALSGLKRDDDWILNANYIDKTFMRHKISYDLFREMGDNNIAAESAYCRVYENNEYQGLYVLMEKINAGMLQLNKQDSMAIVMKDPPIFRKDTIVLKSNKHVQDFRTFLAHSSDSKFLEEINEWIDIANVIDWHLLLLLSNNSDGILKNFYLYKKNESTPFRIAIWDYDHSYGRDGDNELNLLTNVLDCNRSILFSRLMQTPSSTYPSQLQSRYHYLRTNKLFSSENIDSHWNTNYDFIQHELVNNALLWPNNGEFYYDDNDFQEEKKLFFEYLHKRFEQLDSRFQVN